MESRISKDLDFDLLSEQTQTRMRPGTLKYTNKIDQNIQNALKGVEAVYEIAKNLLEFIKKKAAVEQSCYRLKAKTMRQFQKSTHGLGLGYLGFKNPSTTVTLPSSIPATPNSVLNSFEADCKVKLEMIKNSYLDHVIAEVHHHENLTYYLIENTIPKLEDALKKLYDMKRCALMRIAEVKKIESGIESNTRKAIKTLEAYRVQKHNINSIRERYILSMTKSKDLDAASNKLKILNQRINSYQEFIVVLRGLYLDLHKMNCAVLLPKIYQGLYSCMKDTVDVFVQQIETSTSKEMEGIVNISLRINDIISVFKNESARSDSNISTLLLQILQQCNETYNSSLRGSPIYVSTDQESDVIFETPVMYRREDIITGWIKLGFVLIEDSHKLIAYDPKDVNKKNKYQIFTIDLKVCVVIDLDQSYTGLPHSLQLITVNDGSKQFNTFSLSSRIQKEKWMLRLWKFKSCCFRALSLYGVNQSSVDNMYQCDILSWKSFCGDIYQNYGSLVHKMCDNDEPSICKSIKLIIHYMKSTQKKISGSVNQDKYLLIFVGEEKRAESNSISDQQFAYEDAFEFNDLCPHSNFVSVVLFEHRDFDTSVALAFTTIQIPNEPTITEFDSLVQLKVIKPSQGIQVIHPEEKYYLRLSYVYRAVKIMPISCYVPFLNILISDDFELIKIIDTVIDPRSRTFFSSVLLDVLVYLKAEINCFKSLIKFDIEKTKFLNTMFRSNTVLTKLLDQYFRTVGDSYLKYVLSDFLDCLSSKTDMINDKDCSTSIDFENSSVSSEIVNLVQLLWDRISNSKSHFPIIFRSVLSYLVEATESKWPSKKNGDTTALAKYFAINSFVFLRFLCPAIMSPHLFGIVAKRYNHNVSSQLKTYARIMQSLANIGSFTCHGKVVKGNIGAFIESNTKSMMEFMDNVSQDVCKNIKYNAHENIKFFLPRNIRYKIECVVGVFVEHKSNIRATLNPEKYNVFYGILNKIIEERMRSNLHDLEGCSI